MAFRLPNQPPARAQQQHHQQQAYQTADQAGPSHLSPVSGSSPFPTPLDDDSREWVLFSPTQAHSAFSTSAPRTHTASTERTPRLSDFGSLGIAGRSSEYGGVLGEETTDEYLLDGEENTELDSLDDGLHAFRAPSIHLAGRTDEAQLHHSDPALLPAHDGLGTFPASSLNVQEQLWLHERFNPRRRPELRLRRLSSVQRQFDGVDESHTTPDLEHDRWQRIEQWRMEQSKALLQEIEKETTRKRRHRSRSIRSSVRPGPLPRMSTSEVMGDVSTEPSRVPTRADEPTTKAREDTVSQEVEESFLRRITRKVIRDIIGLDDSLLSVIFGESLVTIDEEEAKDTQNSAKDTSNEAQGKKRKASTILSPDLPAEMDEMLRVITTPHHGDTWWQERLLDRIARELGILVHQIYEHPSAFTTYTRSSPSLRSELSSRPSPADAPQPSTGSSAAAGRPSLSRNPTQTSAGNSASVAVPDFTPTLQDALPSAGHAASWGIEENQQHATPQPSSTEPASENARLERDAEYWERELDLPIVFQFLRHRLAGKFPFGRRAARLPASHQRVDDPSRREAIIRRHHPLVARAHDLAHSQRSLQWQTSQSNSPIMSPAGGVMYNRLRRSSSSCASQSTRISVSTKRTVTSGSSRHYWDIGGSVGSGSAIVSVGGAGGIMGSWGDV